MDMSINEAREDELFLSIVFQSDIQNDTVLEDNFTTIDLTVCYINDLARNSLRFQVSGFRLGLTNFRMCAERS